MEDTPVRVQAAIGGRRITLDPIMDGPDIAITPRRVESSIPAGFRVDWLNGSGDNGVEFTLSAGAGFGSPWMTLTVKRDGKTVAEEVVDMRVMVTEWMQRIVTMGDTPEELRP